MNDAKPTREQRLYDALKRIAQYDSPERIRRKADSPQGYLGLEADEALEMAYENVLSEARAAIRNMPRPKGAKHKISQSVKTEPNT